VGLKPLLLGILASMIVLIGALDIFGHFDFHPGSYLEFAVPIGIAGLVSAFYTYWRKDEDVSGLMFGLCFLASFSLMISIFSYFGLAFGGPRIDDQLAAADRALGISWPAIMAWCANHPFANSVLWWAYWISIWQVTAVVALLALRHAPEKIELLCLTLAICGLLTVGIWTMAPSFGAITVYFLPESVARRLPIVLDLNYAHRMLDLYKHGPGRIDFLTTRGLVAFPSFHAAEAVIAIWFSRQWRPALAIMIPFNAVVLASTPVQGGHHVVDLFGGIAVAFFAIFAAQRVGQWAGKTSTSTALDCAMKIRGSLIRFAGLLMDTARRARKKLDQT
jgi:hypothetical protein